MDYAPLRMQPCFKEYLWGGRRIAEQYYTEAPRKTAEAWVLASHPAGNSPVLSGSFAGADLEDLARRDKAGFWGSACRAEDRFPLMVKIIDAQENLSVQVHPSEENADTTRGEQTKAEVWYVIDAAPGAFIYYGLLPGTGEAAFRALLAEGRVEELLNRVEVKRGDIFPVYPGTVHAIGAGCLMAEVQQSSDTTFRLYDYNRVDSKGKHRELHLERGLQVLDYAGSLPLSGEREPTVQKEGGLFTPLWNGDAFRSCHIKLSGAAPLPADPQSFGHVLCIGGGGCLESAFGEETLYPGSTLFLPAAVGDVFLRGEGEFIFTRR